MGKMPAIDGALAGKPAWVTAILCPAIVIVPVLAAGSVFEGADTETFPVPVPAGLVRKAVHVCAGTADQEQPELVVTEMICVLPAPENVNVEGVTDQAHVPVFTLLPLTGNHVFQAD